MDLKHVLSIFAVHLDEKLKVVIGFFARHIQSFDLMKTPEEEGYVFIDQRQSEVSCLEKAGITSMHAVQLKPKRHVLAQGGFDHRVRLFSLQSLKLLVTLKFHTDIVNQVHTELATEAGKVNLFSVSEDGFLAQWTVTVM